MNEKIEFSNYPANQQNVDGTNRSHRYASKENTCCFRVDKAFELSSMIIMRLNFVKKGITYLLC